MRGWLFTRFEGTPDGADPFERLFRIFKEILLHTSGDVSEALAWMNEVDRAHGITTPEYGMADFIQDLIDRGYIRTNDQVGPAAVPTAKMESALRKQALDDLFHDLRKAKPGRHNTRFVGTGEDHQPETRSYEFGDAFHQIAVTESLRNAQIRAGIDSFSLIPDDLEVYETQYQTRTSTVLMIDISHSMILYGEDRITPAKKVALALSEWITTRYPKDSLEVVVFGDDAWQVSMKELPYLEVGPYHTNTVAGLEMAMHLLNKSQNPNKQIIMITDGKPTCIKKGNRYYKNPFGLDRQILRRTLTLARIARKREIPITTFMIATDPYLVQFVRQFTEANRGSAFYASLDGLGSFVFRNYQDQKRRRS